MNTYTLERMTTNDYYAYMSGSLFGYTVERIEIEAKDIANAITLASADGYVVNRHSVTTVEQYRAELKAKTDEQAEYAKKEAEKKAHKAELEMKKAEAMGLTVEEYRKEKSRQASIRRITKEIEELEEQLKEKRAYLERLTQ